MSHLPLHLDWPECRNARDLGGTPTADGGSIRPGALIRTDGHERLTSSGMDRVRDYGVTRIIDLRRPYECEEMPSPFACDPMYHNVNVHPDNLGGLTVEEIYQRKLDHRPDLFATAMGLIADAPEGGVVIHCVAGKDRTGLLAAFSLHIAGVALDVITADYVLTDERLQQTYAEYLAMADASDQGRLRSLYRCPPEVIPNIFAHLTKRYGSVEGYLEKGGMTSTQSEALRSRLRA